MYHLQGSIVVFDSGIGGITVLETCKKRLPDRTFCYYGDNDNAPYGNLPPERICALVFSAVDKIALLYPAAVVLGCNTATALCAEQLRLRYSFPVIGAEPAVALGAKRGGEVYVLTTRATNESARFRALCARVTNLYPNGTLVPIACDDLAGAIERSPFYAETHLEKYLPKGNPQAVVLGCTHYIYWKDEIAHFYGCQTLDGNDGIARRLCSVLSETAKKQGRISTPIHLCPQAATKDVERVDLPRLGAPVYVIGTQKKRNANTIKQMFAF